VSCYPSSWRDLRRRDNAGSGWLNKPEITPPSNSNHFPDVTVRDSLEWLISSAPAVVAVINRHATARKQFICFSPAKATLAEICVRIGNVQGCFHA
jgi:hypothetical protein